MADIPPDRRVGRVRLRAASEDDVRPAVALLTDALRTATLPGADEARLVVIRRLAVGPIRLRVSPSSLALQLTQAAERVAAEAVPWDAPGAGAAAAVRFPDRAEPLVMLARLLAGRRPADQWFWPMVLPALRAASNRAGRWLALLDEAHTLPEAAVIAASIVHEAISAGADQELLSAIPAGRAFRWMRLEGWDDAGALAEPLPGAQRGLAHHEAIVRAVREWGPSDDRVVWLATMVAVQQQPTRSGDRLLPARLAHLLLERFEASPAAAERRALLEASMRPGREAVGPDASAPWRNRTAAEDRSEAAVARAQDVAKATSTPRTGTIALASGTPRPPSVIESSEDAGSPAESVGFYTPYAGLLLIVPVLCRLRFPSWLAVRPDLVESRFPFWLLWFVGMRAGMTDDDPLVAALEVQEDHRDGLRDEAALVAWTSAVRHWCRRRARLTVKDLVARPGTVEVTRTHVHATFALSLLDTRVRRLALDVDPGWVPWLGHVIQFHYTPRSRA